MAEALRSYGLIRRDDIDESSHRVTAVISTEGIGRDGAVIHQDGWDFTHYDRNPVVLFGHDDASPPLARMVEHHTDGDKLIATAEFDAEDEGAMRVFSKIQRKFINATSVRWNPLTWEFRDDEGGDDRGKRHDQPQQVLHFLTHELLEFSFVPIPADPNALIVRADGKPLETADFGKRDTAPPPEVKRTTRDELLDDIDFLRSNLETYGIEAFANRLRNAPDSVGVVLRLHGLLGKTLLDSELEPFQGANTLFADVERELRDVIESMRDAPSSEDLMIAALAKQTGRTPDAIREEIGSMA